jgi:CTP:molybdopterin cytidylyltransferase MocA
MIAGIVLAAGRGRRFEGAKQLAPFRGRPLLEHALETMAEAPVDEAVVVLGAEAERILAEVELHGIRPVCCAEWATGQGASLRAGVEAVHGPDASVVTLGDQPLVSAAAIARLISERDASVDALRAGYGDDVGHPVLLERALLARIDGVRGDVGARELLADARVKVIDCEGLGSPVDVDTREQLEELERTLG